MPVKGTHNINKHLFDVSHQSQENNNDISFNPQTNQVVDSEGNVVIPFKLGIDENGNYGYYKEGADSVTPFKSGGGLNIAIGHEEPDHKMLWIDEDATSVKFNYADVTGLEEKVTLTTQASFAPSDDYKACTMVGDWIYFMGSQVTSVLRQNCTKYNVVTNAQVGIASLPSKTVRGCPIPIGDIIYYVGGSTTKIYAYDTTSNTWETKTAVLPAIRYACGACAIGTDIYILCGNTENYFSTTTATNTIFKYDTIDDTIETYGSFGASLTGMPQLVSFGNNIYVFGGHISWGSSTNNIYKYNVDTKQTTVLTAKLPAASDGCSAVLLGTKIYVSGGSSTVTMSIFDVLTEEIEQNSDYTVSNGETSYGFEKDGSLYFCGGKNGNVIQIKITTDLDTNVVSLSSLLTYFSNGFEIADGMKVTIGNAFIGDSNNYAVKANAYIFNGTNWINVNTGEEKLLYDTIEGEEITIPAS